MFYIQVGRNIPDRSLARKCPVYSRFRFTGAQLSWRAGLHRPKIVRFIPDYSISVHTLYIICILYLYVQLYTYLEGRPQWQRFYGVADGSDGSEESRSLFPAAHEDRWPGHVGDRQECATPNGTCFIIPSLLGLPSILASHSSHPGSILHKPLGCRCHEYITLPTRESPNNSLDYFSGRQQCFCPQNQMKSFLDTLIRKTFV